MKVFAVDIGNTNIHIGIYAKGEILDKLVLKHNKFHDFSGLREKIEHWIKSKKEYAIKGVSICSVFGPAKPVIDEIFCKYNRLWVTPDMRVCDLNLNYSADSVFGADRFANLVAFRTRFKKAGAVIDIGSALTFDIIDKTGDFRGGIIIPGPELSSKSLQIETDKLPQIRINPPAKEWGFSTEECINCGIWYGYKTIIADLIARAKISAGSSDFFTVAAGGFDLFWKSEFGFIDLYDPNFTLKGAGDIYFSTKE